MKMQIQKILFVVIAILFLTSSRTYAATINYQGSDLDGAAARWRTTSVAKPLEYDDDNLYGTDGWAMWVGPGGMTANPADARVEDLPSYVSYFAETSGSYVYRGTYASIDDPTLPMPAEIVTGGLCTCPGSGIFTDQLSFTITSDCSFSLGVMTDTSDSGIYIPIAFKLTSSTGGFCEIAVDTTQGYNLTPDFYAFDIADAVIGETFTLSASGGSSGYTNMAAVTWDLGLGDTPVVPEPSMVTLVLGALISLKFLRRVKK